MGGFTLMKRPGPKGRTQRAEEHAIMVTTSGAHLPSAPHCWPSWGLQSTCARAVTVLDAI